MVNLQDCSVTQFFPIYQKLEVSAQSKWKWIIFMPSPSMSGNQFASISTGIWFYYLSFVEKSGIWLYALARDNYMWCTDDLGVIDDIVVELLVSRGTIVIYFSRDGVYIRRKSTRTRSAGGGVWPVFCLIEWSDINRDMAVIFRLLVRTDLPWLNFT